MQRYNQEQIAKLRRVEGELGVREKPEAFFKVLSSLQKGKVWEDLKRDVKSYCFRGKFDFLQRRVILKNYSSLEERIQRFYSLLEKLPRSEENFCLYRSVKPQRGYEVDKWSVGDCIPQVLPMSTSLYLDSPLDFLEDSECALLKIRTDSAPLLTSREVDILSKEEARSYTESSNEFDYTQSELTLLPGELQIRDEKIRTNPLTGLKLTIFEADYRTYSQEEWKEEYQKYG